MEYGVGVANGTEAIWLALRALGVGQNDEVVTVSHTAVATVAAIELAGATPVFADIDPESYTLCPVSARKALTKKTKAILAVHLYGNPCDMDGLGALCEEKGLFLVEDCAQAHGAKFQGTRVGAIGDVGCFSFFIRPKTSAPSATGK